MRVPSATLYAERRRLNMIRPGLLQQQHLAAVLMVTGKNFFGNAAHLKQRRLPFRLGDKGPHPLQPDQQAFIR